MNLAILDFRIEIATLYEISKLILFLFRSEIHLKCIFQSNFIYNLFREEEVKSRNEMNQLRQAIDQAKLAYDRDVQQQNMEIANLKDTLLEARRASKGIIHKPRGQLRGRQGVSQMTILLHKPYYQEGGRRVKNTQNI